MIPVTDLSNCLFLTLIFNFSGSCKNLHTLIPKAGIIRTIRWLPITCNSSINNGVVSGVKGIVGRARVEMGGFKNRYETCPCDYFRILY